MPQELHICRASWSKILVVNPDATENQKKTKGWRDPYSNWRNDMDVLGLGNNHANVDISFQVSKSIQPKSKIQKH